MKASFKPVDTDELQMTLTVTMPMRAWRHLHKHITPMMGTSAFRNAVEALIAKADENFTYEGIHDSGS